MPSKGARVNIRMNQETHDAYTKVATFFNRSTADIMREALESGLPGMQALGAAIDQANAGNAEAAEELFGAFWKQARGQLDLGELTTNAAIAASKVPQEGGTSQ
jgi:predicted DNA-binding protein